MLQETITQLNTEKRNPNTMDIDRVSTTEILTKINTEDATVAHIVHQAIDSISKVVDYAYETIKKGGRIVYVGAGTSGRLGVLDASECPPTYGVSSELFQGIMAGGTQAMFQAKEGVEDSTQAGQTDLQQMNLTANDFVIGLAASGRTPYVIGALTYATSIGTQTASISCVDNAKLSQIVNYPIEVVTGPEVVTGSTRMKAGTAQKLVLNMISTATMIKCGKVYENYMVDVMPSNQKLIKRAIHMIQDITQLSLEQSEQLFYDSGQHVKTAVVMALCHVSKQTAKELLQQNESIVELLKKSIVHS